MAKEVDPAGFEQRGHSPVTGLDELAKALYERGSIPLGSEDQKHVPPEAVREAAAAEEAPKDEVVSPEDEVVEAAGEPEGEGSEETEEEGAEETEEGPPAEVEGGEAVEMVDMGDGTQVPLEELVKGSLRQADYTRKTQELAEQRKALEQEKQALMAQHAQAGAQLHELTEQLQRELKAAEESIDLDKLRAEDPAEYSAKLLDLQRKKELENAARAQQEALYQQQRYEIVMRERAALESSNEAFKENFDDTYSELTKWVTSPEGGGLPPEMWDQVYDHRAVLLAHKAMQHDNATRKVAPKVARKLAKTPKVVRPGQHVDARQTRTEEYEKAMTAARKSGTLDDLAKAFQERERLRRGR